MKFFYILKVTEERSRIQELDPEPGSLSQRYGTDPGIRIQMRTKMSQIPKTEKKLPLIHWFSLLRYTA
jgi:hypothetical protein